MEENENVKICKYCGEIIEDGDDIVEVNFCGETALAHRDCAEDKAFYCDDCGNWFDNDIHNRIWVDSEEKIICEDCYCMNYFTCEHCGSVFNENYLNYSPNDNAYCDDCYQENFTRCEGCGCVISYDDAHYCSEDDNYYCDDCIENFENDRRIYSYHDFDDWRLFKNENEINPYYIGYELEVEHKNNTTATQGETLDILENNLNVVFMHDGSLNDTGFEIVSHPQTFKYLQDQKEKMKTAFDRAIENGYISHNSSNCGLHFHFTAPKENRDEIVERIWIILETYKDEISKLSRRKGCFSYCKFLTDTRLIKNQNAKMYYIKKCDKMYERYLALNNRNTKTIEFRFFRGTLNIKTFFADLEFVNNIYNICCDLSKNLTDITWKDLIQGEHIFEYCAENDIYSDKTIIDDSMDFVMIENKINRLYTNIKNILIKSAKRKYAEIIRDVDIAKYKDLQPFCSKMYNLKDSINYYYGHLREFRFLLDNIGDFSNFQYYFNTSDILCAFDYFLNEDEKQKLKRKYEKLKKYYNKIETGVI